MADDIRSDIIINVDTSVGIAEIKNLQRQISQLNSQLLQSGAKQAQAAQNIQRNLINNINATGKFAASVKTISSTAESFTTALERNKLGMGEYFKYAGASTKTFGRLFKNEFDTIQKVAESRVKTLQTQYIKLGRDANGALKAIAVRPLALDMDDLATKTAIAAQKQQLFNQLLKQGSTNLLNFGKNTQWAGRQLMVGFTIPLAYMGAAASKTFMQMEEQVIKFKRVYGELFTTEGETQAMVDSLQTLGKEFTKYGIALEKTMELAANAAAMGKTGADLLAQVEQATKLAVLGNVEQAQALETTISITNAFGTATEKLAGKINFLNAVENQTVTSIEDLTIAIPKAGPVVQQLGGDVEDLAFFLTAMKEGGINASEGANALKSGLASLINPTDKAAKFLEGFGINLRGIVEANKGDVKGIVVDFAKALDQLDPLSKARSIEQLFGKFQFARLSTLFQNVIAEGSQAQRVLKLTNYTTQELAILSEREMKKIESSPMYKFKQAVEDLKISLIPLGEAFLKAVTPIINFGKDVLERFNSMGEGAKNFTVIMTTVVAGIGPVLLMTFGLIANGVANLIKFFTFLGNAMRGNALGSQNLASQTQYMTQEQLEAAAVASSLDQAHSKLTQTFNVEASAVNNLATAYARAVVAQSKLLNIPVGGQAAPSRAPKKYARGVVSVPGPKGAGDIVPAMLSPGEAVIPARQSQKYAGLIQSMIDDKVPGFSIGRNPFAFLLKRSRVSTRMKSDDLKSMLKNKDFQYRSGFETGTGDDFINAITGQSKTTQARMRRDMETDIMGIPWNADPKMRPTYGSVELTGLGRILSNLFGLKGRQFKSITSPGNQYLERYGDIDLVGKRRLGKRSTVYAGDLLKQYQFSNGGYKYRRAQGMISGNDLPPMFGSSAEQLDKGARFWQFNTPFGKSVPSGPKNSDGSQPMFSNPGSPYIEAHVAGGFNLKEISKIRVPSRAEARELQKLVDQAGLRIRVTPRNASVVVKALANIFGTRFSNGTDFAHLGSGKTITVEEALRMEGLLSRQSTRAPLEALASIDKTALVNLKHAWGVDMDRTVNNQLGKRAGADIADVARQFTGKAIESRYAETAKIAGANLSDIKLRNQLESYDRAMNQEIKRLEKSGILKIVDNREQWNALSKKDQAVTAVLEDIDEKVSSSIAKKNTEFRNLRGTALSTIRDLRISEGLTADQRKKIMESPSASKYLTRRISSSGDQRRVWVSRQNKTLGGFGSMAGARGSAQGSSEKAKPKPSSAKQSREPQIVDLSSILRRGRTRRYNKGVVSVPGPKGAGDVVPAMLSPGEAVIPAEESKKYAPLIAQMVHGKIPGYQNSNVPKPPGMPPGMERFAPPSASSNTDIKESGKRFSREAFSRRSIADAAKVFANNTVNRLDAAMESNRGIVGKLGRSAAIFLANQAGNVLVDKQGTVINGGAVAARLQQEAMARSGLGINASGGLYDSATGRFASRDQKAQYRETLTDKELRREIKRELKDEKKSIRQARAERIGRVSGPAGGIAGGLAMGAMVMGASGGPMADAANAAMPALFAASAILPMLPMLANPIGATVAAIAALVGGFALLQMHLGGVRDEAAKLSNKLGSGEKNMQAFAEFAGTVTATDYARRVRQEKLSPFTVAPGKTTFGQAFMQTDAGKQQVSEIQEVISKVGRAEAVKRVQNQLLMAITTKTLSADQARSVAQSIGQQLNDYNFATQVMANINQIIGPDGKALAGNTMTIYADVIQRSSMGVTGENGTLGGEDLQGGSPVWWWDTEKVAKAEGQAAAEINQFFEESQMAIDALDREMIPQIEALRAAGNYDEALEKEKQYQDRRRDLILKRSQEIQKITEEFSTVDYTKQPRIMEKMRDLVNTGMFADDPKSQAAVSKIIDSKANALKNTVRVTLVGEIAAGNIDPTVLQSLTQQFDPDKNENASVWNAVAKISTELGGGAVDQLNLIASAMDGEAAADFIANFDIKDPKKAAKVLDGLSLIARYDEIGGYDVQATIEYYEENPEALTKFTDKVDELEKLKDEGKLTIKNVLEQDIITDPVAVAALKADAEYFSSLDEEQKLTYLTTYISKYEAVAESEVDAWRAANPEFERFYTDEQVAAKIAGDVAKQYTETTAKDTTKDPGEEEEEEDTTTTKTDPYESILKKLKEIRRASLNAKGGLAEIKKALGGKNNITEFMGVEQQLIAKGTSRGFIDWLLGQDQAIQDKFITIKNGIVKLKDDALTLSKAFNAIALGNYQANQKQGIRDLNMQNAALRKLVSLGYSYEAAYTAIEDPAVATAIAQEKSLKAVRGTVAGTQQLINLQRRYNELQVARTTVADTAKAEKLRKQILGGKFSLIEQEAILSDEALMNFYKNKDWDGFKKRMMQVLADPEFMMNIFTDGYNKALEQIAAQEEKNRIAVEIDLKAGKFNNVIDPKSVIAAAEDEIAKLQYKIDDWDAGLQEIEWQEKAINETYDEKFKALDKIEKINDKLIGQQEAQLTLADALTQGDISAAAKAAQDFRARTAQDALSSQRDLLEQSRDNQLKNLTSVKTGLTRKQIEDNILAVQKEIFKIEEDRLEPAREAIRLADVELEKRNKGLEDQRFNWEQIKNRVDLAVTSSAAYNDAIEAAKGTVEAIVNYWNSLDGRTVTTYQTIVTKYEEEDFRKKADPYDILSKSDLAKQHKTYFEDVVDAVIAGTASASQIQDYVNAVNSMPGRNQYDAVMMSAGGMVNYLARGGKTKYMAAGGFKPLGSDTVPAMLTPGEFVVRKYAVDNFGLDRLKAINSGTYKGDSMYNYEVNVNVQTDANPDQIAKAVIGQIRQIDSQRIRGNRF